MAADSIGYLVAAVEERPIVVVANPSCFATQGKLVV